MNNVLFLNSYRFLVFFLALFLIVSPLIALAQIVPNECGGEGQPECGWGDLVQLAQNLINFLIVLALPLAGAAFAYAGFLYITSTGSEEKVKKAHGIFLKVGIGLALVLGAWLIVYFITSTLLKSDYIILGE